MLTELHCHSMSMDATGIGVCLMEGDHSPNLHDALLLAMEAMKCWIVAGAKGISFLTTPIMDG